MFAYHSAQLSHTWSDFSPLLRVTISETRILCHFILILLSSTLMKQLTDNVGIISIIHIFCLDIWLAWLVPAHRYWRYLCSLHNLFFSELVTLYSAYCAWFVALLAPPYVVCRRICPYLLWLNLIVQFTSEFSLSCTDLCKFSTEDSDHVIL